MGVLGMNRHCDSLCHEREFERSHSGARTNSSAPGPRRPDQLANISAHRADGAPILWWLCGQHDPPIADHGTADGGVLDAVREVRLLPWGIAALAGRASVSPAAIWRSADRVWRFAIPHPPLSKT
jgi:hypothetical protein